MIDMTLTTLVTRIGTAGGIAYVMQYIAVIVRQYQIARNLRRHGTGSAGPLPSAGDEANVQPTIVHHAVCVDCGKRLKYMQYPESLPIFHPAGEIKSCKEGEG